jgi:protein NUD1
LFYHQTNLQLLSHFRNRSFSIRDVRDVKRLYLSGNALPASWLTHSAYNLTYLELAACRLTALPPSLSTHLPNLRALNLNYNFIEDVSPLEGLGRLGKVTMIGSRMKGTKGIVRVLRTCPDVEVVDFRYGNILCICTHIYDMLNFIAG